MSKPAIEGEWDVDQSNYLENSWNIDQIHPTPLNRATSVPGYFDPIKRRNLLTENILF